MKKLKEQGLLDLLIQYYKKEGIIKDASLRASKETYFLVRTESIYIINSRPNDRGRIFSEPRVSSDLLDLLKLQKSRD